MIQPTEWDRDIAKELAEFLRGKFVTVRVVRLSAWTKEFAALRSHGVTKQRLRKVFDWYLNNFRKPYVPLAFSARGFRDKFPNIEVAMERSRLWHKED